MRVLIVDDERLALQRLRSMLDLFEDIEIVGEATNGQDAIGELRSKNPDLVFLDVEMPMLDGFDVVDSITKCGNFSVKPLIVFVTAYPMMAARAFETGVVDFLTKPLRLPRLEKAMDRARHSMAANDAVARLEELRSNMDELRRSRASDLGEENWLWVPNGTEILRVDCKKVEFVSAESEYIRLFLDQSSLLYRQSLTKFVEDKRELGFIRVHRSHAVRTDLCKKVSRGKWGGYSVTLNNGRSIPVGRTFRQELLDKLGIEN